MNETIKHQMNHRTIRFFKDRPVEQEIYEQILAVMNRTASSTGMQTASVIHITDPAMKQRLAEICKQDYVADIPELFVFIVDTRRLVRIAAEKGYEGDGGRTMDKFLQAFTDGVLMAQNMTNAVESFGLGAVYLGSVLNDPQAVIELLKLPELTMPIVGLGFGYPDDHPQLKPRMDVDLKVHENTYQEPESWIEVLREYDEEMTYYYDTREKNRRSDSYTDQAKSKITSGTLARKKYMQIAERQGFDIGLDL